MELRTIKKYPNRRLYDMELSRYVTVDDVRDLVLKGVEFRVIDSQTDEDITRNILIQIITEHESGNQATFTTDMLARFIRLSHDAAQEVFSNYFDHSMRLFLEQQQRVRSQMQDAFNGKTLTDIAQQNLEFWQGMQENFLKAAGLGPASKKDPSAKGSKPRK